MRQASDIKSALGDAENSLRRHVKDTQSAADKAARIGQAPHEQAWAAEHLQRVKDDVKNLQAQSDYVQRARSAHQTGKSPLATPMTKVIGKVSK
jgi:hypothetical protein